MLVKCERCGAPLEVPAGSAIRCPYCGTTASAPAPQAPPQPPAGYGYGPALQNRPQRPVVVVPTRSRVGSTIIGIIITVGILAGVAAGVAPLLLATGSPAVQAALGKVTSAGGALSLGSWSSSPAGCFIDANGDGISDMAGLTGPSETNQATVVDGKSGQVLFTAPAVKKAEQLGCLGDNGFFLVEGNFQVDFFTARSPWGRTQVMARDKVSQYGEGSGCVQLRTDDGSTQGIQLPGGAAVTCAAATLHRYYGERAPGMMGLTDHSTELNVGTRKYNLTQRASGTEILTVRVTDNNRPVWEKELSYASCTFGAAIAVAPGKILLWAAEPSDRDKGILVGLDEATGNQLYQVPITDTSSDSPEFFRYNGKYVLAVNWGALRAYEPATGAEAWRVGR